MDIPNITVDAEFFWLLMVLACTGVEMAKLEGEKQIVKHGRHVLIDQAAEWLAQRESEPCPKVGMF